MERGDQFSLDLINRVKFNIAVWQLMTPHCMASKSNAPAWAAREFSKQNNATDRFSSTTHGWRLGDLNVESWM